MKKENSPKTYNTKNLYVFYIKSDYKGKNEEDYIIGEPYYTEHLGIRFPYIELISNEPERFGFGKKNTYTFEPSGYYAMTEMLKDCYSGNHIIEIFESSSILTSRQLVLVAPLYYNGTEKEITREEVFKEQERIRQKFKNKKPKFEKTPDKDIPPEYFYKL